MNSVPVASAEAVFSLFAETMFRLMVENYQKQVGVLGLTMVQAQLLRLLQEGSLSTGELAARLAISAPAVTQSTNRLVRKHLIERRAASTDRRSVLVALAPKGRKAMERFRDSRSYLLNQALAHLPEAAREQVVEVLEEIMAAVQKLEGETALSRPNASKSNTGGRRRLSPPAQEKRQRLIG